MSTSMHTGRFKLDENNKPIECGSAEYFFWQQTLPVERRTGIGFRLQYFKRNGVAVSTVYLGMDHGWGGNEKPILWETMVFADDEEINEICERYDSHEDALIGHREMVDKYVLKGKLKGRT